VKGASVFTSLAQILIALAWPIDRRGAAITDSGQLFGGGRANMPFCSVWWAAEASRQRLSDRHAPLVARALAGVPGEDAAEMAMVGEAASQGHLRERWTGLA
jgi:hypothetical protein